MASTKLPTRWIETSDGFIPAPDNQQPTSVLHLHVLDTIEKFKISSFDAFAMKLVVTVGSMCDIVTWNCKPDPNTFKFGFGWPYTHDCTLATRLHKAQVQVYLNSKWTPMIDYLEEMSKHDATNPNRTHHLSPENMRESILKVQREWWAANKKHFPLLSLPAELRNEIYRHASPQDAIEPYADHRMRDRHGVPFISHRNEMVSNLLRCSKVVCQEMRDYMFRRLSLLINHERLLRKTLRENLFFPRNDLTSLIISFRAHQEFFRLFGIRARDITTDEIVMNMTGNIMTARSLCRENLPFIKKFEIIIPSREKLHLDCLDCQTGTINMMMEIMWPHIKGQPIILGGMIKKWQKEFWEAEAAQAHKEYEEIWEDEEDGGVPVTQQDIDGFEGNLEEEEEEEEEKEEDDCSDCDKADCWIHGEYPDDDEEEDEEEVFEYHLPFSCECRPDCLQGEWTDADKNRDE